MRLSNALLEFGFESSPVDTSLFVYHDGNSSIFFLIYVDDILVTSTDSSLIHSLIIKLQAYFKMKNLGRIGYFLGIQATRDTTGLHLQQSKYVSDLLSRTKMASAKPVLSACTIGQKLSSHAGDYHLQAFYDVDWAGDLDDRHSITGYAIFLGSSLISWFANKQSVVARFSTEVEYRALAMVIAELYWVRMLLKNLHITIPTTPTIWRDNSGAIALASNPVFHNRTKHIKVDFHFIREKIANKDISLQFLGSSDQQADVFTKGLSSACF
ncbi:hypothetical protein F2P56_022429 [Juglans regia]|uniref:Reverse transcriptase Ty1/copia-type domain-containing protein n=1 Tax=Juglans regia TaxID=51240 RepID=A0A833UU80_JUGRE|nr:hypothetical protein F2P56_022429 [Juglans regia]